MNTLLFTMPFLTIANVISAFRVSNASGKIIVIILFLGSIFAWSIMATKFIQLKSAVEQSKRFLSAYKNEKHPMRLFFQRQKYPESPLYKLYQAVSVSDVEKYQVVFGPDQSSGIRIELGLKKSHG